MRLLASASLLLMTACDAESLPPSDPVDMTFRAAVTELENDCGGDPPPADALAKIDVRLRLDGTVDIGQPNNWVPGPGFEGARVVQGRVSAERRWPEGAAHPTVYRIDGALTMGGIDVTVEARRPAGDGLPACVRRVRAYGPPRGFLDREDLDGAYNIRTSYYGEYCEGGEWPVAALGERSFVLDASPRADRMYLSLDGIIYVETGLPGSADDALRWDGVMYVIGDGGLYDVPGRINGTFRPDGVGLLLEFRTPDQPEGCVHVYTLKGHKMTASRYRTEGSYRAAVRSYDDCGGTEETFEGGVTLVDQRDGWLEVRDPFDAVIIRIGEDGALSGMGGSEEEGLIATFVGASSPPYVAYTLEYRLSSPSGSCVIGRQVDAVARYFPELPWEPVLTPMAARKRPPRAEICRVPEDIGPLSRSSPGPLDP